MRQLVIDIIRKCLMEHGVRPQYLIDRDGYYVVPDPSKFIDHLVEKNTLLHFFKMHFANLEVTKGKREIERSGLDQYDFPEGIDNVIRGGETLLGWMELALRTHMKLPQSHIDVIKRDILSNPGELID